MSSDAKGYGEFVKGWPVVLSAMLGISLGLSPIPFYTIGVLAPELAKTFHWSFAQIFLGVTVTPISVIVCSPIVGILSDRFGVRRVALTSVVLFALTFMAFALTTGSLVLYYLNWAALAAFGTGTLPITWTRAVNNWFYERRGLALGLSLFGTGLFSYLGVPFTRWVIDTYGWRAAYVAIGALPLLIVMPTAFFFFHDVGPASLAAADRKADLIAQKARTPGLTVKQVFADWRFWLMGVAFLPIAFSVGGVIPNLVTIFKTTGLAPAKAVGLASLIGLSVVAGRLVGGWLMDRIWAPIVALMLIGVPAMAYWLLGHGPFNEHTGFWAVILIGLAAGAEYDLMSFLVARYFGMKAFSIVYGALYSFFSVGAGIGPAVYGAFYDKSHSYAAPLTFSAVAMVIGALLLLGLGKYPSFQTAPTEEVVMDAETFPHSFPV
jgi:predicted MFS family arabinose efflux permease